jgi:hypothetical protein
VEEAQQEWPKKGVVAPALPGSMEAVSQIVTIAVEEAAGLDKREEQKTQEQQTPLQLDGGQRPFDGSHESGVFGLQPVMKGAARALASAATRSLAPLG